MVLHLSALVLGTNAIHAFLKHYLVYGLAFTFLTITSLFYHTCEKDNSLWHQTLFWLDQAAIFSVFLTGAYYTLQIPLFHLVAAALSIGLCILYYHYGRLTQQFCWDPQFGPLYHGVMHGMGSLGHHAILLGLV